MSPSENPVRILASTSAARVIANEVSRRRFLSFLGAAGATGFLAACAGPATSGGPVATGGPLEKGLSIYTWGTYDDPKVLDSFGKDVGPTITLDSYASNEELISKLVAAKGTAGYDIVVPTGNFVPQMIQNKLLSKLNMDLIPNVKKTDPLYLGQDWDPKNEYTICKAWGTTGFVYDSTVITRELSSWADFIDAAQNEASGKTSVLDVPIDLAGIYFWANGIDYNTTDEKDLAAAEKFLVKELAPHISAFDSYPGGEAIPQSTNALIQAFNGDARIGILNSENPNKWKWAIGAPETELWMDNWAIAAGSPNPEAAHAFINYVLEPDISLKELEYIGYHTGTKDIQKAAADASLPMLDLVFFTDTQLKTMKTGKLTDAQQRLVEIWNATKAAAGA